MCEYVYQRGLSPLVHDLTVYCLHVRLKSEVTDAQIIFLLNFLYSKPQEDHIYGADRCFPFNFCL